MNAADKAVLTNLTAPVIPPSARASAAKWIPAARLSQQHKQSSARLRQQLVWVLMAILFLLYLATSYCFWAKAGSAWPIAP